MRPNCPSVRSRNRQTSIKETKISPRRPQQQHEEIAQYLLGLIRSGELAPGDPLPSEAELCQKFDSSRGPVRQAVGALRAEGLISSGRGRRSIVLLAPSSNSFDALLSTTALLTEEGREPGEHILRIAREPAWSRAAEALELDPDSPVVTIERMRTADEVPVLLERLVFPLKFGEPFLSLSEKSESVHRQLTEHNVHIDNVVRTGRIHPADEQQADLLAIEAGSPLWCLELRASTFQGEHVEYAEYFFRADMVRMTMSNVRGGSIPIKFDVIDPDSSVRPGNFGRSAKSE